MIILMMHCYDISGKYCITFDREMSGPPGDPNCRGTSLFSQWNETSEIRLAQIYKAFRGTHDICLQDRRLNLAFCVVSLLQELVNRLTGYSNILSFLLQPRTLCHPLVFPERKNLASFLLEPHYLAHSSSICSDPTTCTSSRLAPSLHLHTTYPARFAFVP